MVIPAGRRSRTTRYGRGSRTSRLSQVSSSLPSVSRDSLASSLPYVSRDSLTSRLSQVSSPLPSVSRDPRASPLPSVSSHLSYISRTPRISKWSGQWLRRGLSAVALASGLGLLGAVALHAVPQRTGAAASRSIEADAIRVAPGESGSYDRVHQGIDIDIDPRGVLSPDVIRYTFEQITRVIDTYPDRFVADTCGVRTVGVHPRDPHSRVGGSYTHHENAVVLYVNPVSTNRSTAAVSLVHEIDHACVMTNRTLEDFVAWDSLVTLPEGVRWTPDNPDTPTPKGFARWYGASSVYWDDPSLRHIEDQATIKELITYNWGGIDSRDDRVLKAKVDLHIDWYARLSGGVMDEDYFRSWSE